MKKMKVKKVFALMLAFVMLLAMSAVPVGAEESDLDDSGTITIQNAVSGQTYSIYKMFDLESYDTETKAYLYTITDDSVWYAFAQQYAVIDNDSSAGSGTVYLILSAKDTADVTTYYVEWNEAYDSDSDVSDFAKLALEYAEEEGITPTAYKTATATDDGTVAFENLELGYYLVDSTVGTLCALDTTDSDAEIVEKNVLPTVEKTVGTTEGDYEGDTAEAQIGDRVYFQVVITAQSGAQNYVLHDTMSEGLTLYTQNGEYDFEVMADGGELGADSDYRVEVPETSEDGCTFEITFTSDYLDSIAVDTEIVVTYSAVLNQDAFVEGDDTGSANTNTAYLTYGNGDEYGDGETTGTAAETEAATATVRTYQFGIVKTNSSTDEDGNYLVLDGAQFKLYKDADCTEEVSLVYEEDGGYYRVATDEDDEGDVVEYIEAGTAAVKGLDAAVYYLKEITAPNGYSKLKDSVEVDLTELTTAANASSLMLDGITNNAEETEYYWAEDGSGVQIKNVKASILPSTGGVGTTIFYIAGAVLVIGAGVLLAAKKRANAKKSVDPAN